MPIKDLQNEIDFPSRSAQTQYFANKKIVVTQPSNYTFVRMDKPLRVSVPYDACNYACYMMFKNPNHFDKWFYAFVKKIRYINDTTTEIEFKIDPIQTYMFDYEVEPCFVEREHHPTDGIWQSKPVENLDTGQMIYRSVEQTGLFDSMEIVIASTAKPDGTDGTGKMFGKMYSAVEYTECANADVANSFLSAITQNAGSDGIISVFMMPTQFSAGLSTGTPQIITIAGTKNYHDIDGYKPVNNKLFNFPFNYVTIYNGEGNSADFRYEYFPPTDIINFEVGCDLNCSPQAFIQPVNYKGVESNISERLTMSGFPQCPFAIDSYKAYLAQNCSTIGTGIITDGISAGTSAISSAIQQDYMGMANGFINYGTNIAKQMARYEDMDRLPPQARGGQPCNTTDMVYGKKDFWIIQKTVDKNYARMIDGYFSMFGYLTKQVENINTKTRQKWNYIKTVGADVVGSIPVDFKAEIEQAYDAGLTFWHVPSEFGKYVDASNNLIPNPPVGG